MPSARKPKKRRSKAGARSKVKKEPAAPTVDPIVATYQLGWELFVARATIPTIHRVLGIDHAQFMRFVTVGVPGQPDCPGWSGRIAQLHAEVRRRERQAADLVSEAVIAAIEQAKNITLRARGILVIAQNDILQELKASESLGIARWSKIPSGVLELIRTMRQIADFDIVATAYTSVFGDVQHAYGFDVPRSIEASVLPAVTSIDVTAKDRSGSGGDVVAQLLPESDQWTDAEIDEYVRTGNHPTARVTH